MCDEDERARAERRLRAAVRVERRLLVAGERCDADGRAEQDALDVDLRPYLGKDVARDAEEREQLVVPLERREVEQHRARRVRAVGRVHARLR